MYKHRYNYHKEYVVNKKLLISRRIGRKETKKKKIKQNADTSEDRKKKNGVERLSCTVSCLKT